MSADFVAQTEDLLVLYVEHCDSASPVVCFYETFTQMRSDVCPIILSKPDHPLRRDYE